MYKYNIAVRTIEGLLICTFGTHMNAENYMGSGVKTYVKVQVSWL
jgi:hypothetical protein